jgi:hypothetical protein
MRLVVEWEGREFNDEIPDWGREMELLRWRSAGSKAERPGGFIALAEEESPGWSPSTTSSGLSELRD